MVFIGVVTYVRHSCTRFSENVQDMLKLTIPSHCHICVNPAPNIIVKITGF